MSVVGVAATQMHCSDNLNQNIASAEKLVRAAVDKGAQIILLQELFESLYFCQKEIPDYFDLATSVEKNPAIVHFSTLAKELDVVIPVSFFEKHNQAFYNSIAVIDADGCLLGVYRKTHIPDGPGYEEKFYFTPGDTGFQVWHTKYAKIGIGICWDQWFPETARCMALMGAEILFYPTAIGSEPDDPDLDSKDHWQTTMLGHSAANMIPVVASNRIGSETIEDSSITFYGSSFISENTGQIVCQADRTTEGATVAQLDLDKYDKQRTSWGLFRDRRPSMYKKLLTKDGKLFFDF
jgi:N-carbamoylputrescine amidase